MYLQHRLVQRMNFSMKLLHEVRQPWEVVWAVIGRIDLELSRGNSRGEVEHTRLEAKAKDTKKAEAKNSLSEDRPSRGPGPSRGQGQGPRTQAQVFYKKRFSKFFSGDFQFIGVPRIFDWGRP